MNVSKIEQRVLHALAQGGVIRVTKDERRRIEAVECFNREGWVLHGCTVAVFKKLKAKRAIASQGGGPYRVTRVGLMLVRPQLDNR